MRRWGFGRRDRGRPAGGGGRHRAGPRLRRRAPRGVSGRMDPRHRHPARDRFGGDEGDPVAARAGVFGARERDGSAGRISSPAIEDRDGRVVRRVGGRCRPLGYTSAELEYIREALRGVTSGGTASSVFSGCPLDVSGKTGTAERPPFQDTSWFAGIVPSHDPRVRGGGHRGAGRVRRGDRRSDRAQHHEPDLPHAVRGARARGAGGLMDLVAGRVYADERRPIRHIDGLLLLVTAMLLVLGFFLLYSATNQTLRQDRLDPFLRVNKQMVTAAFGVILVLVMATFDYRFLKVYAGFIYAGIVVALLLVRIPVPGLLGRGGTAMVRGGGLPDHAVGVRQDRPGDHARREPVRDEAHAPDRPGHDPALRGRPGPAGTRLHPARHRDVDRHGGDRRRDVPRGGRPREASRRPRRDLRGPDRAPRSSWAW